MYKEFNLRAGIRGGYASIGSFAGLGGVYVCYGVGNAYAAFGARLAA